VTSAAIQLRAQDASACGGFFHGKAGAANRTALAQGATELLEEHGFKKDETAYIGQEELPMKDLPGAEVR